MKKSIKRLICVMLACMMFITTAFALTGNKTLEAKDIEVEVYAENLSAEKIEYIKQAFLGTTVTASISPDVGVTPDGIFCIFGHDLEKGSLIITTHRYYSTAPRCLEEHYDFEVCKRSSCDYAKYDYFGSIAKYCCQ